MHTELNALLKPVIRLAELAGEKIMEIYQDKNFDIKTKIDKTPVTKADLIAHKIITEGLIQLTPDLPVLSEESKAISFETRKTWQRYWLIDPLDGTKEFIDHLDNFTINIALIDHQKPVLGVVYAPALACCYFACEGQGAFKQTREQQAIPIKTTSWQGGVVRVTTSHRHGLNELQLFLKNLSDATIISRGSALKFALIAEGEADIYPRLTPTSEWDTAAGQCIVEQAGGAVIDCQGNALRYNTKESLLNPPFLAVGDVKQDWLHYF